MSIHTVTLDEFMQLTREQLELGLSLFDKAITEAAQGLPGVEHNPEDYLDGLSELTHLITLRKVFDGRLEELEQPAPEPAAGPLASQQWQQNERQPQLA